MRPSSGRRTTLPPPTGPLIGRTAELDVLRGMLPDPEIRLVTLTGPPGVGKTRLALAAATATAAGFADGVVVVDLTTVRDPELVPAEVAGALGQDGSAASDRLSRAMADRSLLLLLDNVEHVLPAAAWLGELLADCPGLTALATSRERLRLRTERELPVPPLALPGPAEIADAGRLAATPAVALLVRHVQSFDPAFAVTPANREVLAEICVRLDGLPLALELAAPRLRLFNPGELLFRLRHRVGSLAADARDVPDRHRTLSTALAWSHDLLGPHERVMFRRLSVFVGGWTLAAAAAVCAVADPLATTESLLDKSLIRRTGTGDVARFGMLESLREFATEQLQLQGEEAQTRERHAEYFADLAVGIERRVGTAEERAAIEEVGLDVGNLRTALAHHLAGGRAAQGLPVAAALGWYCYTRGQLGEGQATLDRAVTAAAGVAGASDEALASGLIVLGAIALAWDDVDTAEQHLLRSLEVDDQVGSVRLRAIGTAFLGHVARARGRAEEAVARHTEAGSLHGQLANLQGVAWSRYDLGLLARRRRESERAAVLLRESLHVFRELHYAWAIGCSTWALATVELGRGRVGDAAVLLGEALDCFEATDDVRGVAQCLEAAAGVAASREAPLAAARLLGAATAVRARLPAPVPEEEQGAVGAVRLRLRHGLGAGAAENAERTGRQLPTAAAVTLARHVLAGRETLPPGRSAPAGGLTPREAEVAGLVRTGRTNRQIGRQLGISEKTTEVHVHNIIRKLGASSRAEIAAWVAAGAGPGEL
jgi:predicted ATPase/DNA-binding CsgD family transcriptional regulator